MIELVWDTHMAGTVTTRRGGTLGVGDDAPFGPEDLFSAAVAASVMQAFIGAAAEHDMKVLAYLSTAEMLQTKNGGIHLDAYIATAKETTDKELATVAEQAVRTSPVARLLGRRLMAEWHLHVLHGA